MDLPENVRAKYPKTINNLIEQAETDKLRRFDLPSFMSGPTLEEALGKIDKTMTFLSVYIVVEELEENLWEDDRYAEKEELVLCPYFFTYDSHNHFIFNRKS